MAEHDRCREYRRIYGAHSALLIVVTVGSATLIPPGLGSAAVESDNAALLARVVDGEESAWNELVDRFAGLVWSVARSFHLSAATTDDVVQTVWLRLAEYSSRIREPDRLAAWLATATRNEALRVIKGQQRVDPALRIRRVERADEPLHRGHHHRRRHPACRAAGVRRPAGSRPTTAPPALHRATPRLPDDRRDPRAVDRQHRSEQGQKPRQAPPAAPGGHRPESRWTMTPMTDHRQPTDPTDDALQELLGLALRAGRPGAAPRHRRGPRGVDVADDRPGARRSRVRLGDRADRCARPRRDAPADVPGSGAGDRGDGRRSGDAGASSASSSRLGRRPCASRAPRTPSSRRPTASGGSRSTAPRRDRCASASPTPTAPPSPPTGSSL